jgi:hypothetical protein
MPQELWRMVLKELPSLTGRHAAEAFGFELEPRHQKHSSIWNWILNPNDDWTRAALDMGLVPFLAGDDLHKIEGDAKKPVFIVLLTGDETGKIREHRDKLLSSLRPHDLRHGQEVVFHESNIVMNVVDALYNTIFTALDPKSLFRYEDGELRSACLYWKDREYAIRYIGAGDIVGIGGQVATLQSVSYTCGITFNAPEESAGLNYQKCFAHPKCPPAYPLYPSGGIYRRNKSLGWQWGEDHCI